MRKLSLDELGRSSPEEFSRLPKLPIVVVLDNIRSALNVGSVFRTADAFAFEEILLCGITARPPHREIHKTAIGATESVAWRYFDTTDIAVDDLRSRGYRIFVAEQTTRSTLLQDIEVSKDERVAIVFGNEVSGVSDSVVEECDAAIEIPQYGTKHSLNVAVSAGIVLWELQKRLRD